MKPLNIQFSYGKALLSIAFILALFGIVMIYSSSATSSAQRFSDAYFFLSKQIFGLTVSIVLVFFIYRLPIKLFEKMTLPILVGTVVLLTLIFIPPFGHSVGGGSRWLNLFGVRFQPAEIAKLAMVLFLAKNLSRPNFRIQKFWLGVFPNVLVLMLLMGLLIKQPDLGSAVILAVICFLFLFIAGMSWKLVGSLLLSFAFLLTLAIFAAPYRLKRIMSFLDPWGTMREGGFQIVQSFLAFKNGGWFGVGFGQSKQKLFFLPEAHNDFILALIGEELGLLGVLTVVLAFVYICYLGFMIMHRQQNNYRKLLAFGLLSLISFQALMNMAVVMGAAPTKGISLPFVSAGISSLIIFSVVVGLLARLDKESQPRAKNSKASV